MALSVNNPADLIIVEDSFPQIPLKGSPFFLFTHKYGY